MVRGLYSAGPRDRGGGTNPPQLRSHQAAESRFSAAYSATHLPDTRCCTVVRGNLSCSAATRGANPTFGRCGLRGVDVEGWPFAALPFPSAQRRSRCTTLKGAPRLPPPPPLSHSPRIPSTAGPRGGAALQHIARRRIRGRCRVRSLRGRGGRHALRAAQRYSRPAALRVARELTATSRPRRHRQAAGAARSWCRSWAALSQSPSGNFSLGRRWHGKATTHTPHSVTLRSSRCGRARRQCSR